jgi:DNA-binding SARP family transcriptional activator
VGGLELRLLGELAVRRGNAALALPASRKVRALVAWLALSSRPVSRVQLCELLGDVSSDPRGELRWCLSKIRALLDDPDRARVVSSGESISLDLEGCHVDALEVARAAQEGIGTLAAGRLQELSALFAGEFLDALELDRSPQFNAWLISQRRRFRACHLAILERLVKVLPADSPDGFRVLEKWLQLASLDLRAHEIMLETLACQGRLREGTEHLAAAERLFEADGLDPTPLREAWQTATKRHRIAVSMPAANEQPVLATPDVVIAPRRASIAVMPLADAPGAINAAPGNLAGSLVHDVITRLAKLRSLAVIAEGTVFALAERGVGPEAAGRTLGVDYVASGSVRRDANRVIVMMELAQTRTARIIWSEDFNHSLDDTFLVLDEIGNRIVAAIASEIELAERNRAMLKPPSSLDAWEAHHRGLWHMYRFNAADNEQAQRFFRTAVQLDPTFSRAHAGLSFTHFQNAFLFRLDERQQETDSAMAAAAQGLIADERDPAAHLAMGRALWLRGEHDGCLVELEQAVELSPNFALGHYMLAFVQSQSGDARAAIRSSDYSRRLSPFDPLLFAMLAARAMAHVRLGEFEEATKWALNAASRPNAHVHVRAIAAHCLAGAGRLDEGRTVIASIRKTHPAYRVEDYLTAFRFDDEIQATIRVHARALGFG